MITLTPSLPGVPRFVSPDRGCTERLQHGGPSTHQPALLVLFCLFSSSKVKFIIHKPENLYSSGKAVSFKVFLCWDVLIAFPELLCGYRGGAVSGPVYDGK